LWKRTFPAVTIVLLIFSMLELAVLLQPDKVWAKADGIVKTYQSLTSKPSEKDQLDNPVLDVSQLTLKRNLNHEAAWSTCTDRDSIEYVIGLGDLRKSSYSELLDAIISNGGELINEIAMDGKMKALVVDVPHESAFTFVSKNEIKRLSEYIEPNLRFEINFVPNDPKWEKQYGPHVIEADYAWNTTKGDPSVLVAVIDTGVEWDHPDLADNYVPLGYDWVNNDTDPMDDNGHGTHCAGIIGAVIDNDIGIAGLAQVGIISEKVMDRDGSGYIDDIANGIVHAVDQGADILSLSLGGYGESTLFYEAVKFAHDNGVLVIAAVGNDASECKQLPASYEEVIAVTATDEFDKPAEFTNFGDWIECAAPGDKIWSTYRNGTYALLSGTSMSTPHVAGVAALIWSKFPNLTRDQIRSQLRFTAQDLGALGFDEYFGYGRVNARRAVEQPLPNHDLSLLYWKAPYVLKPFDTVIVNGTLLNFGASDESDITLWLLINGSTAESMFVSHLVSGTSTEFSFEWTPVVEGKYNVTLYVEPVHGEVSVENNVLFRQITVRLLEELVVPNEFSTIQKAINAALFGYTIRVISGLYSEHIIIDKSLTLSGEDRDTTIIDGYGTTYSIIRIIENNATVARFTVQNAWIGIEIVSHNNSINENIITLTHRGCWLTTSDYNNISRNIISNNSYEGIRLEESDRNTISNNALSDNWQAILAGLCNNNIVNNNTLTGNKFGIYAVGCFNNTINNNPIAGNKIGIWTLRSDNNTFYHNSFIDNIQEVYDYSTDHPEYANSINFWQNGYPSGGNYWSDYTGTDMYSGPNQNEPSNDGIGDSPLYIDKDNQDRYPLMAPVLLYKHDLAISLWTPASLITGNSTIIGVAVYNLGLSDESNISLQLIIGSITVDFAIPRLNDGSYFTFNYSWTPIVDGNYEITARVNSAALEHIKENNIKSVVVVVYSPVVGPTKVNVFPHENIVVIDQNLTVKVTIANVTDLLAWQVNLLFNATQLECTEVLLPSDHIFAGLPYIEVSPKIDDGSILFGCVLLGVQPGVNGSGVLMEIRFKAKEAGSSTLRLNTTASATCILDSFLNEMEFETHDSYVIITKLLGDLNGDGKVDIKDIAIAAIAFGSYPSHPRWNPIADINQDGKVDIKDLASIATNFGKTCL